MIFLGRKNSREHAPGSHIRNQNLRLKNHLLAVDDIDTFLYLENNIHTILLYEEGYLTIVVEACLCAITDEEHTNLF